jgi:hypothetical protein
MAPIIPLAADSSLASLAMLAKNRGAQQPAPAVVQMGSLPHQMAAAAANVARPDATPGGMFPTLAGVQPAPAAPVTPQAAAAARAELDRLASIGPSWLNPVAMAKPKFDQAVQQAETAAGKQPFKATPPKGGGSSKEFDALVKAATTPTKQTNTTSTTQRTSAEYGPEEVKAAVMAAGQREIDAKNILHQRQAAITAKQDTLQRWVDQIGEDRTRYGKRAEKLYARFEQAGEELAAARARLEEAEINPHRLWQQMPATAQAMGAIGMALQSFSGKGAQAWKVINGMIERDLGAQRAELQKRLRLVQLSADQQKFIWSQYTTMENAKRDATRDLAKLEIAKAGLESDKVDARAKASDVILAAKQYSITAQAKGRERVVRQSKTVTTTGTAAGGKTQYGERNDFGDKLAALRSMAKLKRSYIDLIKTGKSMSWAQLSKTAQFRKFNADLQRATLLYGKSVSGSDVPEKTLGRIVKTFPQVWQSADILHGRKAAISSGLYAIAGHMKEARSKIMTGLRGNPGLLRLMGPEEMSALRGSTPVKSTGLKLKKN